MMKTVFIKSNFIRQVISGGELKMANKTLYTGVLAVLIALCSGQSTAQEEGVIRLTNQAFKEVAITNEGGDVEYKLVEPGKVLPEDEILYVITFTNTGDQPAGNIVITDPIPNDSLYKKDSAFGAGTVIDFSVDGGKTYDKPENLKTKNAEGVEVVADVDQYTHIRWIYTEPLQPGQEGTVTFRTIIK